jgi:hypothetical protein
MASIWKPSARPASRPGEPFGVNQVLPSADRCAGLRQQSSVSDRPELQDTGTHVADQPR